MNNVTDCKNTDVKLTIAKFSVLILSILIFMVGSAIVYKSINLEKKAELQKDPEKKLNIYPYKIKNEIACGQYLCLIIENENRDKQLVIINPAIPNDIKYININEKPAI